MVKVGDQAPDFTLRDDSNTDFNLSTIIGNKYIVVYFYPKDNTPVCTKEACHFRDNFSTIKQIASDNVAVYGISIDTVEDHAKFKQEHNLPFSLLSDPDQSVARSYGVTGNLFGLMRGRKTFLIDKQGKIALAYESQLFAKKHVKEVIETIQKLEGKK
jgi:peroxiredoxin Q/BCP